MQRRRQSYAGRVFLAALVLAVAACSSGGGSKSASSSSPPTTVTTAPQVSLTKTQYIDQANAICDERNDQLQSLPSGGEDPELVASSLLQAAGIESRALTRLRKLPPPAGDADTLAAIYDKVEVLIGTSNQLAAAYRAGNVPKAKDLQALALQQQKDANDGANAYGMASCGA